MICVTREQLAAIRPRNNNVLVKVARGNETITLADGETEISLDTSFEKTKHAVIRGTVIQIPDKLVFDMTVHPRSYFEWETDMQVQVGDEVIFNYLITRECLDEHTEPIVICEGEAHFPVPYPALYVAKRRLVTARDVVSIHKDTGQELWNQDWTQIIPLNGYNIMEPIEVDRGEYFPEHIRHKAHDFAMRVAYPAKPNRNYKYGAPDIQVNPGQVFLTMRNRDIPLEYDLHASLDGKRKFYICQSRYFLSEVPVETVLTETGINN